MRLSTALVAVTLVVFAFTQAIHGDHDVFGSSNHNVKNETRAHATHQQPEERLMRLSTALVAVTLVVFAFTVRASAQTVGAGSVVASEILVKFTPGAEG